MQPVVLLKRLYRLARVCVTRGRTALCASVVTGTYAMLKTETRHPLDPRYNSSTNGSDDALSALPADFKPVSNTDARDLLAALALMLALSQLLAMGRTISDRVCFLLFLEGLALHGDEGVHGRHVLDRRDIRILRSE